MRLRSNRVSKVVNISLDVLAAILVVLSIIPIGWIAITASIFLGVEWYEWVAVGIAVAFIAWRGSRWY